MELNNKVRGIAHDSDVAKITVVAVPDRPGIAAALFQPLASANISVDVIVQNASIHGKTDMSFTVARGDLPQALRLVQPVANTMHATEIVSSADLAKVSVVGTGMQHHPGYASRMFTALAEQGINIDMITTSEIRITCLIDRGQVSQAVHALHDAFQLDRPDLSGHQC